MIYYYTNTGHKIGLERLRRGVAMLKYLSKQGYETQLLVNDFRAGLVARDLGADSYVTVEGVQDIDAIAQAGDSIIIDSVEDDHGRLVKYCADFEKVWRFAHDAEDKPVHGETVIPIDTIWVDERYFDQKPKEERVVFFLGDADYDKIVLSHADFFESLQMELLLGNYFFVKYEDDLAKIFTTLHEPEEYDEVITSSDTIVTASTQTAFEAKASGAKVIYLDINNETLFPIIELEKYGISVVKGFDEKKVSEYLKTMNDTKSSQIQRIDDKILSV